MPAEARRAQGRVDSCPNVPFNRRESRRSPAEATAMIGQKIGPYEVTAKLGEGGMGRVFRARDTKLDRDVALKVLPDVFAGDADRVARFEREAKTLASLNHPNIAHVYD